VNENDTSLRSPLSANWRIGAKGDKLLSCLNSSQRAAVSDQSGPCLIIAGAGTGKTTVITRKIAYLIAKKLARPAEILALTFTEKAAEEMEGRVDLLVPYGFVDTQISTFHAFGDRLLRDYAIDLGLPANFKILSETERAIFMRENLYAFELKHFRPLSNPVKHIEELLKHFSRLKDELITPQEYLKYVECRKSKVESRNDKEEKAEIEKSTELANAYERYQDLMLQAGNLDYGDQIFLTYKLLKENPKVLKECQRKFKYILVDEFQDTNYAQYQIVRLLAKGHQNITVVGDDDQSIYRFRGASISNILSFKKDYPKCKQVVLNQNYRSSQEVLDAAYKLIQHNNPDRLEVKNKIDKRLVALMHGPRPELLHCDTLSCEADQVAEKILELKKQKKYRFNDFAILARANTHLEPFIQALNAKNIPNIFVGASSLFSRPEVKMLVAFFKCLAYDDDNLSFYQLATSELYGINENLLAKYYSRARRENKSFEELFEKGEEQNRKIGAILRDIRQYRAQVSRRRAGEILYEYLRERKYFKKLTSQNTAEAEVKVINIAKFFDRLAQFDHSSENKSVLAFLENLELILSVADEVQSSDIDPDLDAVNVMTVHAAKGLEWPMVFIVNMVVERFPTRERREKIPIPDELIKEKLPQGDFHLQEERRLFYVGCTRAKVYLFISAAEDYGGKRAKKLSQFALELLDEPMVGKMKHKLSALEKIERYKAQPSAVGLQPAYRRGKPSAKPREGIEGILKLSRQQIDDYYTCPKKYYFSSVVKIPLPTDWHFMYGTAIHEAVGRYFARKLRGAKPDYESLVSDFNQSFTSEGFITREHEEERKRKGLETLAKFYDEDQKINLLPDKVEQRFEFNLGDVKISGRYDLVLTRGAETEIYDFKTSDVKSQKDADRRVRESTQMMIYALAWLEKYKTVPKTTLIFIESDLRAEKKFTSEELDKTRQIISDVAAGVKKANFKATPSLRQCSLCPYKDICEEAVI